jgi:ABC-type branched-subunit amino acid transport system substrate-binding protein
MQGPESRGAPSTRRLLPAALVTAGLVIALLLSACGSSSSSSSSTSSAAAPSSATTSASQASAPSGSPIKTMTITSLNSQGPVYPNISITAQAYEKWINAHGGINGHPLQVTVCDDHGKPTEAAACSRQAVAQNVVAVVGSFSFFGTNIMPALIASNIPNFGECCAITPPEWTSTDSFPMGTQPLYAVGLVKHAVADGCKHINAVIIDGAQGFEPVMTNAMKAYGKSFGKVIILPPASQDYSPQVAEATGGGADCVVMIVSETPYIAWNQAWVQSGTKARMYGPQGNLDSVSIKGLGNKVDGSIIAGMYPDISTAPWADYRQALKNANADPSQDYNSLGGLGTWAAYTGMTEIMDKMSGPINNLTFKDAVAKTTSLDTHGMVPVIDFTKPWTAFPAFSRLFNRTVVYSTIKNGKVVPLTTTFEDVSNLALGKQ